MFRSLSWVRGRASRGDDRSVRVGAAVPPGAARKDFSLLVDTLEAPFISAKAAEDYEVIVGFTGGAADAAAAPGKKRHSRSKT